MRFTVFVSSAGLTQFLLYVQTGFKEAILRGLLEIFEESSPGPPATNTSVASSTSFCSGRNTIFCKILT